jgi:NodT family efflux transporter outer membrane factor (OMF) lipoprotein
MIMRLDHTRVRAAIPAALALLASACTVGPKYQRPTAVIPPAFKESPPAGWKAAQPQDGALKGKWWEIFNDPQLNALEEQVNVSNQNIAQAEANFRNARAAIMVARAAHYPTVNGGTSATAVRQSSNRSFAGRGFATSTVADYLLPLSASYELDVWGRIRRIIEASVDNAQATAADLETARLLMASELAADYFQMRGLDAERQLLDSAVGAYEKALQLTTDRFHQGIASRVDVALAQTQLETTRAQATDTAIQRAQFEHAIAVLTGKPPAAVSIAPAAIAAQLPKIPVAVPSEMLERRPDVAAEERRVAAANAQIGIAQAAYYPTITLSASAGLESSHFLDWFTWPSRFWSAGAGLSQTLFEKGRRRGLVDEAVAAHDATVAGYRQSVLAAFQDVEDNLAALSILEQEATQEDAAVKAAEDSLNLATVRYKGGIASYLEVITAQSAALADQRTAVGILTRRMTASVLLVKALGGGWNASQLPTNKDLIAKQPVASAQPSNQP